MESYIVRVIRRGQPDCDRCVYMEGVVQSVESRGRAAFHNATELWAILSGTGVETHDSTPSERLNRGVDYET